MANETVVSVDRYDLKFGTYQAQEKSVENKIEEKKKSIAKSIGNVIVKMFEDQKQINQEGMMIYE